MTDHFYVSYASRTAITYSEGEEYRSFIRVKVGILENHTVQILHFMERSCI